MVERLSLLTRNLHLCSSHLINLRLMSLCNIYGLTWVILHNKHQVALDRLQAWCNIIAQSRQYLFLDNTLLQFLHLLKNVLA